MDAAGLSLIKTLVIAGIIIFLLFPAILGRDKNNNSKRKYHNDDMG